MGIPDSTIKRYRIGIKLNSMSNGDKTKRKSPILSSTQSNLKGGKTEGENETFLWNKLIHKAF